MLGGLGFVSQPVRICLQLGSGVCYLHCVAFALFFVYPPVCVVTAGSLQLLITQSLDRPVIVRLASIRGKSNLLFIPDSWRWEK